MMMMMMMTSMQLRNYGNGGMFISNA